MDKNDHGRPSLGIAAVVVTYNSQDVILDCLNSLLQCSYPNLRIVICDNASTDGTADLVRDWAVIHGRDLTDIDLDGPPSFPIESNSLITLLRVRQNKGFAGGVNIALTSLLPDESVDLFWLLNPDCIVAPTAPLAYADAAVRSGSFALMGGRTMHVEQPNRIQSDGGRINPWTGICRDVNQGLLPTEAVVPDPNSLDFISGANLVASRDFVETVGLLPEEYFLYFEEVDWAARRGSMPLRFCEDAVVYHHCGTATGSATLGRKASEFANYFNFRNRMRYMRRFHPNFQAIAYVYSMLKIGKILMSDGIKEAIGAAYGLHQFSPPSSVRRKLSPEAATLAFDRTK
ncbi:MAG: glycosyltransferase family 2 protein [bacterium]|nr:glycosyltransferase family 2 protein [bacterium]